MNKITRTMVDTPTPMAMSQTNVCTPNSLQLQDLNAPKASSITMPSHDTSETETVAGDQEPSRPLSSTNSYMLTETGPRELHPEPRKHGVPLLPKWWYKVVSFLVGCRGKHDALCCKTCVLGRSGSGSSQSREGKILEDISRAVTAPLHDLWDNGASITFSFINGGAHQRRKFCHELDGFKDTVNLHISERKTNGDIRISFDNQQGPHSCVGRKCKSIVPEEATMVLSKIADIEGSSSWEEMFIISHEIGHALGLLHEHQSPGRSSWLDFKEKETYGYYKTRHGWDRKVVRDEAIRQLDTSEISAYTTGDPDSIMTYPIPSWLNKKGKGLNRENYRLSALDKALLTLFYPPSKPQADALRERAEWESKMNGALDAIQIHGDIRDIILSADHYNDIRNALTRWSHSKEHSKSRWNFRSS